MGDGSVDVAVLVDALAAAGVTVLHLDPIVATSVKVILPVLRARLDKVRETRELQQRLVEAITAWTHGEQLSDQLADGLAIATVTLAEHGLREQEFKQLDFDPARAVTEIARRAGSADWGDEHTAGDAAHEVAKRAIRATLAAWVAQHHPIEASVLQALREQIAALSREVHQVTFGVAVDVQRLAAELTSTASAGDVRVYLQRRLEDWDRNLWQRGHRPSQLERRLSVTGRDGQRVTLSAGEFVAHFPHAVILGGPGSGKSWLAHRVAREAAQTALDRLEAGASVDQVMVPLVTTWEKWTQQTSGCLRESLVAASFATGFGPSDLGGQAIITRLKRFAVDASSVLVVLDSLDEAKDKSHVVQRVADLEGLTGWRTIITSRPAAWDASSATRNQSEGVAELQPLTWENDAVPFIQVWFADHPDHGAALIRRLQHDARLRASATVPLLLTFYCIYAEGAPLEAPLPTLRRTVYADVIDELLRGDWSGSEAPLTRLNEAKRLLARWAWGAVEKAVTPAGLGVWGEAFEPADQPSPRLERAVDHVAQVQVDQRGRATRVFRHRTLLEHLVAEHIAAMPVKQAAKALLPHLWYDPDWQVAAPAAIAAHPRRDELLDRLLQKARCRRDGPEADAINNELDRLLLDVVTESEPTMWSRQHQDMFNQLRFTHASSNLRLVTHSAHWRDSNRPIIKGILNTALAADPEDVAGLVEMLVQLEPLETERAEMRRVVVAKARLYTGWLRPVSLFEGLAQLEPLETERAEARRLVVADLLGAGVREWDVDRMVEVYVRLSSSEAERAEARRALWAAGPWPFADRVEVWLRLEPSEAERAEARRTVVAALPAADPGDVAGMVKGLVRLVPLETERAEARPTVVAALQAVDPFAVRFLVEGLMLLEPSEAERAEAHRLVVTALEAPADPGSVADLVEGLMQLEPPESEKAGACRLVVTTLQTADPWSVVRLVEVLARLKPSEAGRAEARRVVIAALTAPLGPRTEGPLLEELEHLAPSEAERADARRLLLAALRTEDYPWHVVRLVKVLRPLEPSEAERAEARRLVLAALSTADRGAVGRLVEVLVQLEPSEEERAEMRPLVLAALLAEAPWAVAGLVELLVQLASWEEDRAETRGLLVAALSDADPRAVGGLVDVLVQLEPSEAERAEARRRLVAALPVAQREDVARLVEVLVQLAPTESERRKGLAMIQAKHPGQLGEAATSMTKGLRACCTPTAWLTFVACGTE